MSRWASNVFEGGSELASAAVQRTRTVGARWRVTRQVRQISASKRDALSSKRDEVASIEGGLETLVGEDDPALVEAWLEQNIL